MRFIAIILGFILSFQAAAFSLRSDAPRRYTVQSGDTLWGIASRYLENPWEWKDLWYANPKIKNPNHLYVGAIIELRFNQHNPYLRVLSNGTIKLSPYMRKSPIGELVFPIPLIDIMPFLNGSLIMDENRLLSAPYIVAYTGEHMLGGQGDEVYVKNLYPNPIMPKGATISYAVYRPGCPYREPVTGQTLGYKATLIGYGELVRGGEPATMVLTDIKEGVKLRDRVMLNDFPEFSLTFLPKAPGMPIEGLIIELASDFTQGAVGLVAIIDKGQKAGLEAGDVLGIYSRRHLVPDPLWRGEKVLLPRERLGSMMIFRTFTNTSFGLVVRSIRDIHALDIVTNP